MSRKATNKGMLNTEEPHEVRSTLTKIVIIIPQAQMRSKSIAHEAKGPMGY